MAIVHARARVCAVAGIEMHPVLLRIGGFSLETYDVVWLIALTLAMSWTVRRFPLYGVDDGEARRTIAWAFIAVLIGAALFSLLRDPRAYIAQPSLILTKGGLSEVGAFLGAFATVSFLCWRSPSLSFQRLCDVAALPAMLTIAVGRWGCFLNGCCVGVQTDFPLAVHFPRDPAGVMRHATQLYYSAFAIVCLALALPLERALLRAAPADRDRPHHAVLAPLALLLYIAMRFSIDVLRAPIGPEEGMSPGHVVLAVALPFVCAWLAHSLRARPRMGDITD